MLVAMKIGGLARDLVVEILDLSGYRSGACGYRTEGTAIVRRKTDGAGHEVAAHLARSATRGSHNSGSDRSPRPIREARVAQPRE